MSSEIQLYNKIQDPVAACQSLGTAFGRSGLFGCDKVEQGVVLAFACMAEGKSPLEIMRDYDIVDGKLRKKSLTMLANFRNKGGKHKWIKIGDDGQCAELQLTFEGETLISRFTLADAQKQNLVRPGSNWVKSPGNMLRARCISNGIAMLCPEIVAGCVDGDDDAPAAAAGPLLGETPAPVAAAPAAAQAKADKPAAAAAPVIDVKAEVAPAGAPGATAAPTPTAFVAVASPKGGITAETVAAVIAAIGQDNCDAAYAWLISKGWLKAGEDLFKLTVTRAQKILNKPAEFLAAVTAASTTPAAAVQGGAK